MIKYCALEKRDIAGKPCLWGEYEGCEKIVIMKDQGKIRCQHLKYKDKIEEVKIPF